MTNVLAANATTTVPDSPGCWANSENAVSTCCTLLGGLRIPLANSTIPSCAYNIGSQFVADDGSTSANSTSSRWSSCVTTHFPAADGSVVISTCQNSQNQIATVTSTPSSSSTPTNSGDTLRRPSQLGRVILAGLIGSGLVHILSLGV